MITAQALSGAAGAVIVPSLVALIAENYRGKQQATGAGRAGFGARGRRRAGIRHRRYPGHLNRLASGLRDPDRGFGHRLSLELPPEAGSRAVPTCRSIWSASLLAAAAIILISFGFNNLNRWGLDAGNARMRRSTSPVLSPAPIFILVGIVLGLGLPAMDASRAGGRQDAAAGAPGARFPEGARRGLLHVRGGGARKRC